MSIRCVRMMQSHTRSPARERSNQTDGSIEQWHCQIYLPKKNIFATLRSLAPDTYTGNHLSVYSHRIRLSVRNTLPIDWFPLTCIQSLQASTKARIAIAMRSRELLLIAQAALALARRQCVRTKVMFTATAVFVCISAHIIVFARNRTCNRIAHTVKNRWREMHVNHTASTCWSNICLKI